MRVNVCARLIDKGIKQGRVFVDTYNLVKEGIPLGLYATTSYAIGDVVLVLEGKLCTKPTDKSIHIGHNMHVLDKFGQYVNHSFEPNVRVHFNTLVAIKYIHEHDEITFNYNDSELAMAAPFEDNGIQVCGNGNQLTKV